MGEHYSMSVYSTSTLGDSEAVNCTFKGSILHGVGWIFYKLRMMCLECGASGLL